MKRKILFIPLILFILLAFCSYFNVFEKMESSSADLVFMSPREALPNIIIIAIDDRSVGEIGQWPWPRTYMAAAVEKLGEYNAAAIGIDVLYDTPSTDEADGALINAVYENGNVILPVAGILEEKAEAGRTIRASELIEPIAPLNEASRQGHINLFTDSSNGVTLGLNSDGVMRNGIKSIEYEGEEIEAFSLAVYDMYCKNNGILSDPMLPADAFGRFPVDYIGGPGSFTTLSFSGLLNDEYPPDIFDGTVCLIGMTATGISSDYYYTPADLQQPTAGIEIHANILQNFMEGSIKQKAADWMNIVLLVVYGAAAFCFFRRANPYISFVFMIIFITAQLLAAKLIYQNGYMVQVFYSAIFTALLYFGVLAFRFLAERYENKRLSFLFGRYVAPQVFDELKKTGLKNVGLGGTVREVTVLFADIRGFTSFSESAEPEVVVEVLNKYLAVMTAAIFNHNGTLDKYMGDAAMAVFNAPNELPDHVMCAVRTALEIKKNAGTLYNEILQKYGKELRLGIGIHTGPAVIGNVGCQFRMDYTAIGDTVNMAARLESNAKPGQTLISKAVYDAVCERIMAESIGEIKVKGREASLEVYLLEDISDTADEYPDRIKS